MRKAALLAVIVLYLAAGALLIIQARDQVNPDGVAYIQNARHYLAGQFDLAVNSYWGPLLSWLLVPVLAAGIDGGLAVRLMNLAWGLGFAAAVASLTAKIAGRCHWLLGFAAAAILALQLVAVPVTPDLMLACLLGWYAVLSLRLLSGQGGAGGAFLCGLLGGVAYLAKNYALPFVLAHLALTLAAGLLLRRKYPILPFRPARLAFAAAGLALVALPWVAVISVHDGGLTIGSAGGLTRAAYAPGSDVGEKPIHSFQQLRPGRLTSWENPLEIQYDWQRWSPFSATGVARQFKVLGWNFLLAGRDLAWIAPLGLLWIGLAGWLALLRKADMGRVGIIWAGASGLLYVLGYCLIHVEPRLLLPATVLLLPATIGLLDRLVDRVPSPAWRRKAATLAVLAVLGMPLCGAVLAEREIAMAANNAAWTRQAATQLHLSGPVAANSWREGLEVCFWSGVPFRGMLSEQDIPAALAGRGRCQVLVFYSEPLSQKLMRDDRFRLIGEVTDESGWNHLWAFDFRD